MGSQSAAQHSTRLGDFTATPRIIPISLIAICIGVVSAFVAKGLLKFIALCTNLFFYQRLDTDFVSPASYHLGAWVIAVPVIGGLIVGLMAPTGQSAFEATVSLRRLKPSCFAAPRS